MYKYRDLFPYVTIYGGLPHPMTPAFFSFFLNFFPIFFLFFGNKNYIISKILGGDRPASGKMRSETVIKTIDYLLAISRKRSAMMGTVLV